MKTSLKTVVLCLFAFAFNALCWSAERGTPDEAMAMVKKAASAIKTGGKDKAFAEFHDPSGAFRDRDLYIFVLDMSAANLVNGANPRLVGKNTLDLKDADGKFFVRDMIDIAKNKGAGWVDYKWPSPATNSILHKSAYIEKVGDMIVGCGIYKQ